MRNVPWRGLQSSPSQNIHPVRQVYAGHDLVLLSVLQLLAPTINGERWTPLARVTALWVMTVIIIILVRLPLPGELPTLPDFLGPLGF